MRYILWECTLIIIYYYARKQIILFMYDKRRKLFYIYTHVYVCVLCLDGTERWTFKEPYMYLIINLCASLRVLPLVSICMHTVVHVDECIVLTAHTQTVNSGKIWLNNKQRGDPFLSYYSNWVWYYVFFSLFILSKIVHSDLLTVLSIAIKNKNSFTV